MPKTMKASDKILEILMRIESKVNKLEKKINNMTNTNSTVSKNTSTNNKTQSNKKKLIIKTGNVLLTRHPNGLIVSGDTYDKRGIIKKFSGWWTPEFKGWTVRENKYVEIKKELELSSKRFTEKISDKVLKIEEYDKKTSGNMINADTSTDINLPDDFDFISDDD
jgi:hypothetical protein